MTPKAAARALAALALLCLASSAFAQTTYTWNQTGTAAYNVSTNWTPSRTTLAGNDVLVFDNGATTTVTNVPVETIGQLRVQNNTNVTLQAGGANTLTISGGAGVDLTVTPGSQLNISGANALTIAVGNNSATVGGNMTFAGGAHKLTATTASAVTFQGGSIFTAGTGFSGFPFNNAAGNASSVVFAAGATFHYTNGSNPFALTQPASVVVFQTGSLYKHQSNNTPSFSGRTYANFELVSGTIAPNGGNPVVMDNLTVTAGTLTWAMTANSGHAIRGNISVAAGASLVFNPASAGTVNLNGTAGPQSITNAGTLTVAANQTINVDNAAGISLNNNVTVAAGALTLTNGTVTTGPNTLAIGAAVTMSRTNGYVIGNLRKTYSAIGNKVFEVGTANGFSPVTANVTAGTFPADLTVRAVEGAQPNLNPSFAIARYWVLNAAGITADLTFQYLAGDVNGNEANYGIWRVSGGTPTLVPGTVNAGADNATANAVSTFSDWTVAEATPTFIINDVIEAEGNGPGTTTFTFNVGLTAPAPPGGVIFDIGTSDGTAQDDNPATEDFDYVPQQLAAQSIPQGSYGPYVFDVTVNHDGVLEADETFFVNIAPASPTPGDLQGQGTIQNDDGPPAVFISNANAVEGSSGTTTMTFDVTLAGPAGPGGVTFDLDTADDTATDADNDYEPNFVDGANIPEGSTGPYQFVVTVNGDNNSESTETFFVNVSNIVGGTPGDLQGVGSILTDDAPPELTIDNVTEAETNAGTNTFTFTVTLDHPVPNPVSFDIATAPGTAIAGSDYTDRAETGVVIPANSTTYTFDVAVSGDTTFEGNDTFFVNVSNVLGATVIDNQGLGTINNDDAQPTISIGDAVLIEGDGGTQTAVFTVTMSAPAEATATVNWQTADGTAVASGFADYVPDLAQVSFVGGDTSEQISITVNGDTDPEGDEHYTVVLSAPTVAALSSDSIGWGVIKNDDAIPINAVNTPVSENFNSLLPGNSPSTPMGWTFNETAANANIFINPDDGNSNSGNTYNYGLNINDPDRAFGFLRSGSLVSTIGAQYVNNTGSTITSLTIQYFGEQWRLGFAGRADRLDFQYSLDATSLTTGTWTNVDGLDFVSPDQAGAGAKNGNDATHRVQKLVTIPSLNIAQGQRFWIRYTDFDATNADDGLAVDDFTLWANFAGAFLSIDDVSGLEGTGGSTTFTFTVSLSQPAGPGGVTFNIATQDNTAMVPADYTGINLIGETIAEGNTSKTYNITIAPDPDPEPTETFFVVVSSVTGAVVADGQGVGTIVTDDVTLTPIHDIQGSGSTSPIVGSSVVTRGVVTGTKSNGFFIQEDDLEGDPATSEGVFVFTSTVPPAAAAMGALVQVEATVAEFIPSADPLQPPVTELTAPFVAQISTGNPLPAPILLNATFPDPAGPFDQLERVEGMRVTVPSLTVSAPTAGTFIESSGTGTSNGRFFGTVTGVPRPFREPGIQAPDPAPAGSIPPIPRWDFNPERLKVESATLNAQPVITVKSGDVVGPITGPLDYGFRAYAIYPDGTSTIVVTPGSLTTTVTAPEFNDVTVASFNLQRLFDTTDDPESDAVLTPAAYNDRLGKASIAIRNHLLMPDIIGVQEAEHESVLDDLAARISADAIANAQPDPQYEAHLVEGNDVGGIDVGFLVKKAEVAPGLPRVTVNAVVQELDGTPFVNPDTSSSTLNDRPPLRLDAVVNRAPGVGYPLTVINNHLRSLTDVDSTDPGSNGWSTTGERVRAKRQKQAEDLANLVQTRQTNNPAENIILVGDFNAFEFNDGFADVINTITGTPPPDNETAVAGDGADLVNPDLDDLVDTPPAAERYSYVHDGNAQNLDHAIVNAALIASTSARRIEHPRIDSDYPETERNTTTTALRISDHDPILTYLTVPALVLPDFSIDLQAGYAYAEAGNTMNYAMVVTNGGSTSANATITFPLPAETTFVSMPPNAAWNCTDPGAGNNGTVTCSTASPMAPGTSTVTLTVLIDPATPAGTITGTAAVDAGDDNDENDSDSASTIVSLPSEYRATKTVSGTFTTGSTVTYTITIFNDKPFAQNDNSGDELTDVLPSTLTLVSATASSGTAVANIGTNTVTWNGSVPAQGGTVTITITATIDAEATGTVSNQATLAHDSHNFEINSRSLVSDDPGVGGTADPTTFTAAQSGKVTATKSVSGTFVQGTNVTYTFVLTNNMGVTQNDNFQHEFTDILPAQLTYGTPTATSGTAAIVVGDTLVWNGSIPPGGTVTITLVCTISPTATGTISNQGQTIFDADGDNSNESSQVTDDPNTAAADDPTSFNVVQANEVLSTKSVSGTFVQGTTVTYTVVMTNNMTVTQPDNFGHEWTDILPSGITLVPGSLTATSGTFVACCGNDIVFWDGSIPSGGTVTLTFQATIDPTATGTISNQGQTIFDRNGDGQNEASHLTDDPNTAAADDPTSFNVVQANEVLSTKSVSGTFVQGTTVTYTVVMTNNMTVTQPDNFGHEWTDILPSGITLVPGSLTATSGTFVACCGNDIVFWDGSIPSGGTVTLTFQATIDPTATGTISNQGQTIFDRNGDGQNEASHLTDDPNTAAVDDPTSFTVIQANKVTATKSVSGSFVQGTDITYTFVLTNSMTVTQPDNFGHEFTDILPAQLTYGTPTATSGTAAIVVGDTLVWNGSIPSGGSVTITLTCTISPTATGTISNQGQTIYDSDGDNQNESSQLTDDPSTAAAFDPTSFTVKQANKVLATKTVSGSFIQGTNVTYTIVMTNNMTVTQDDNFGHEFTDILPSGLTLVPGSFTATSGTNGSVSDIFFWDGSIPSGGTVTLTFDATISPTATGTISNQGQTIFNQDGDDQNEASQVTDDPNTPAAFDPTSFTVVPQGAVVATKSVSGSFVQGTNVTYTIVVTNSLGLAQADNAGDELTDVLPASLTLVSANATSGTAVANTGTNTVTWNGALANGASVTITVTATINASATGTVSNQATVNYDADGNGSNESAGLSDDPSTGTADDATVFTIVPSSAFSATKSVSTLGVPGSNVTYTITLTNGLGHTLADNGGNEFTDVLPASLALVSANATSGTAVATIATNTVTWNGSLASGASVTITINATIQPSATGTVSNQGTASIDADNNASNETSVLTDDPSTGTASDPTVFTVVAPGTFSATKSVNGTTFLPGSSVTYTVTLTNNLGFAMTDNAGNEFTDVLPAALTLVSANATSGTAVATVATNTVTWNGALANGASVTITINATIPANASPGTVSNQGTAGYDADGNGSNESSTLTDDPNTPAAGDATSFTITTTSQYVATKSVNGTTFLPGASVVYTVTLTNNLPHTVADNSGNELVDVLPASLTLVSASATSGTAVATIATNTVTWNGSLASGASVTITINATIPANASPGTVSNQGTASFDADNNGSNESSTLTNDPNTAAAGDPTSFTVTGPSQYAATKTVTTTGLQGSSVVYTITLTNNLPHTAADNAGNEFTDVLPASLQLISATATSGTAVATVGTNTVTWNGSLASGASVTITINATISPAAAGTISNQGTASFDADNNASNESTTVTDDPSTGAANDPTTFTVVADSDLDGVPDGTDNCPSVANPNQEDLDGDNIGDLCDVDTDNDGVQDSIEQAAPNGGDGNGDGTPDYLQGNVASIPAATGNGYLTLQSSCQLHDVAVVTEGSLPTPDQSHSYPHGLIQFEAPCSSATFSLFVHGSGHTAVYRKFGPNPPGGPAQWYTLPGATFGTAQVGNVTVVKIDFSLTDGGVGDDTPVDGVIVDQGGPAAPFDIPTLSWEMLLALAAMLALVAATKMKS